jgi:hypothetical protein
MGARRCVFFALATAVLAASCVMGQSVLCSGVNTTVGYGSIYCLPTVTVTRGIIYTLTYYYSQPFSTSPTQYQKGGIVNDSGTGVCGTGTQTIGPYTTPQVNLVGTGPNYNTYQQVWSAQIQDYGTTLASPVVPVCVDIRYTQTVTFQAMGCCS